MSDFTSAAGGEETPPFSQSSNNSTESSIGFSQPYFDEKGYLNPEYENPSSAPSRIPVFLFEDNDSVTLTPNGQVISGKVSLGQFVADSVASQFAIDTNKSIVSLQHEIENKIKEYQNPDNYEHPDAAGEIEDDNATELSTGFTKINDEGSPIKSDIDLIVEEYKTEISVIASNTIDVPSLSQDTTKTQNSASTQNAINVLKELVTPEATKQLEQSVLSKKKVAPEGVDLTVTKCFYKSTLIEKILKENNRFGILKFSSANGIPINGQTHKIYYSIKELEWMLEQDADSVTTKGSTRQIRFDALSFCIQHPLAIRLFDIIYDMLSVSKDDAYIKVCAVGGNVLRAFFLAVRWARNVMTNVQNMPPDETCEAFNEWSQDDIHSLGHFATAMPPLVVNEETIDTLDYLCNKSSDTDLTIIRQMTKVEKGQYGPPMERALDLLRLHQRECEGPIEFPLIRLKTPIFENGIHYENTCRGKIKNVSETMKLANHYFPKIKWFAQMIPDYAFEKLDYESFNEKKGTSAELDEIKILFCTLQEVKKHNAVLTSLNSDVISQGSFTKLMEFTRECCKIFFDTISPNVKKEDDLQNIQQIVQTITPPASRAMFSILENPVTQPFIYKVLETLNDRNYLSSTKFLEKYKTNVHILTDVTGEPMPVKSTCIAVSSIVGEAVSKIHKTCSAKIRHLFYQLDPAHSFNRNINITINCLKFMESNRSIEDIKDAGEQPMVAVEEPNVFKPLLDNINPTQKPKPVAKAKKTMKPKPVEKAKPKETKSPVKKEKKKGGAKTRKQKNRKTRKRGMRKTRR